ncbi:putative ankyrin repeat protein RBE_0317 [Mytilus edulis]|uniref:putative ankyrin repeat protein RBE_0317 n=1 Tax=Mytilus edulis TaxID=6550 RepID=UPI0039F12744
MTLHSVILIIPWRPVFVGGEAGVNRQNNRLYGTLSFGDTPLHLAVSGGNLDLVKLFLQRADIDPSKENKFGNTPLHAAAEGGFINIVKLLLERADIDPKNENKPNKTLLHSAARGGNLDIVELLLERADIDPNGENKVRDDVFLSYL